MSGLSGKKLAILGASYLQLPVVHRANAMGIQTICIAWAEGAVCQAHCSRFHDVSVIEKEAVLAVAREEAIDGILTVSSDVGVPTVAYVADAMGLTGNTPESAHRATNKVAMREAFAAAGLPSPAFARVTSRDEAHQAFQSLGTPLILKPVDRSGSMGVSRIDSLADLDAALPVALEASLMGEAILEQFVTGVEVSVETISWQGEHHHLAITDKETTGAPHFVELAHHQPSRLPTAIQDKIRALTARGLDALAIRCGASHAEMLITEDGAVYLTEVAGRMGGDFIGDDLVRLSTGYDFTQGAIEVALGVFHPPVFSERQRCSGVLFASLQTPGVATLIGQAEARPECMRAEKTADELRPLTRSADRSGYYIYQADERVGLDAI